MNWSLLKVWSWFTRVKVIQRWLFQNEEFPKTPYRHEFSILEKGRVNLHFRWNAQEIWELASFAFLTRRLCCIIELLKGRLSWLIYVFYVNSWEMTDESGLLSLVGGSTGAWSQSLVLVKQALFYLSHTPALFGFNYFSDRVLLFAQTGLELWSS
jgi:hypothetical protein